MSLTANWLLASQQRHWGKALKTLLNLDFTKTTIFPDEYFTIAIGKKWANNELQEYVDDSANLFLNDGLVIRATYENGVYKSARIHTKHKFFFMYGRIDILAKLPSGQGTWPALWMMSEEQRYGFWPQSGEIDIMEHVGRNPGKLLLCLHTELYNHRKDDQYYSEVTIPDITDDFHMFSLDWKPDSITYYVDNVEVSKFLKGHKGFDISEKGWPFDQHFYLILNLAIGGMLGGTPDPKVFPQELVIRSIKVTQ